MKQIELIGFGQHDGRTFEFRPGLNIIKGPNEAGKTTLQTAVMFALLGNPGHSTLERAQRVDDHI
ncbi:MAG: ATP-binding protein, partial [Anaerolineae bacterium]